MTPKSEYYRYYGYSSVQCMSVAGYGNLEKNPNVYNSTLIVGERSG